MNYQKPRAKINDVVIRMYGEKCFTQELVVRAATNLDGMWQYNEDYLNGNSDGCFDNDEIVENLTTGEKFVDGNTIDTKILIKGYSK